MSLKLFTGTDKVNLIEAQFMGDEHEPGLARVM